MKYNRIFTIIFFFGLLIFAGCALESMDENIDLIELKEGELMVKKEAKIQPGFNEWGFNWKAHHYNGILINVFFSDTMFKDMPFYGMDPYMGDDEAYLAKYSYAEDLPFWFFRNVDLVMHWNEALISSDAVYPDTWFDSNAFITFHYSGGKGNDRWSQFQKMVAARSTDSFEDGKWYNSNGEEIGVASGYDDLILISVVNTGEIPPMFYDEYANPVSSGIGKYKVH